MIWVFLAVGAILYFTPALLAGRRGHPNAAAITALNFFLGWTFLGWVAAFVWALTNAKPNTVVVPAPEQTRDDLYIHPSLYGRQDRR